MAKFAELNAQVLGISIDHVPCLKAWAENLGGVSYPILSDFWPHGAVAEKFGVLRGEGYSERAIFIIDENQVIRYIDIHNIDEMPSTEDLLEQIKKINGVTTAVGPLSTDEKPSLPLGGVVLYCTSWCPDCKRARIWLKQHNIDYIEVDIDRVAGAKDQLRKWTGGSLTTPTFNIDGKIVVDFKIQELREALGL